MNAEDPETMRALDTRLGRMHRTLDTMPGFEDRLADRIAALRITRAALPTAEARAELERVHERERREADRQARVETAVMTIATLGAALAVWRFAPVIVRLFETYADTVQIEPALLAGGTLVVAGAALWALLRQLRIEPRSLVGI
jgi:hypothetical protein